MLARRANVVAGFRRETTEAAANPVPGQKRKLPGLPEEYNALQRRRLREDARPLLRASYQPMDEASRTLKAVGYTLDEELSSEDTKVAVNKDGRPFVLHRGSTTARDWLVSDAAILVGKQEQLDPRLKKARDVTNQAREKYEREPGAIGHSLGGRLASESGASGPVFTYNAAAGLGDIGKEVQDNVTNARSRGDIVSLLSMTQRNQSNREYIPTQNTILQRVTSMLKPAPIALGENLARSHSLRNLDRITGETV